jgi:alkyl hydroperoxide reductase subunit AhpC
LLIGPDKRIKLMLTYPIPRGRNFDEILRVIDSRQLTARHKVVTPASWKQGYDVPHHRLRQRRRGEDDLPRRMEGAQALSQNRQAADRLKPR